MPGAAPIPMQWHGDAMLPLPGFAKRADQTFTIGQVYRLVEVEERSEATHRHEFAWLREAWMSLPEALADQFATPEHLRKRALIETGHHHETVIDCGSQAAALRVASFARGEDDFAHVVTRGALVVVRKAKSQSRRAMDRAEFQNSKSDVLAWVSALLGVTPEALARQKESA
jgi:hypothetical protein